VGQLSWWGAMIVIQYLTTMISSGFNAAYFWGYRTPQNGRRIGAITMTFISLATLTESLYFGWLILYEEPAWLEGLLVDARYWLVVRSLVCAGSLFVSGLIVRRWLGR
jgi:hypothetical protein